MGCKYFKITFLVAILATLHARADIKPFSLQDVELNEGSDFWAGQELNHEYLLLLDPDNLLFNFRTTAGLPAPGQSYGGWEGSNVEVRGQFIGHYLSALAFAYKSIGDEAFKARADGIIAGLAACQGIFEDGYLAAFPKSFFDRLESLQPVWAPYYVIHKIMAGLLDQHRLSGNPQALPVLTAMAGYFCGRSAEVVRAQGVDHWHQVLEVEFGGMNDVLYQLSIETSDKQWAACAAMFDKPAWFDPLVAGNDVFSGLHANTHLAQVNGFVSRFEATGDETAAAAVANFFSAVTSSHSFSTGGSNWFERWGDPQALGNAINKSDAAANTEESCTTYNVLKIARSLFRWTGRADLADFYERAILNGVMGVQRVPHSHSNNAEDGHAHSHAHPLPQALSAAQRSAIAAADAAHAANSRPVDHSVVSWPEDPGASSVLGSTLSLEDELGGPGQYIYYMPLGHEGGKGDNPRAWTHGWGDKFNTFWCCYGTAVESFSKMADSIYFWWEGAAPAVAEASPAAISTPAKPSAAVAAVPNLFVNQLVSSTLRWRELGVTVAQSADLYSTVPNDRENAASKTVNVAKSTIKISVSPPANSAAAVANGTAAAEFYLHWRLPAWLKHGAGGGGAGVRAVKIFLNGRSLSVNELPRASAGSLEGLMGGSELSGLEFGPPKFGQGADYVILGPEWSDGDTLEIEMAMRVATEDLNDSRKALQALKAVVMGPFHMVGISEGDWDIDLDHKDIASAVSAIPDPTRLVSVLHRRPGCASNQELRLQADPRSGELFARPLSQLQKSHASAMAATFKLAAPLLPGSKSQGRDVLFSLESMSYPGHYLQRSSDSTNFTMLLKRLHSSSSADSAEELAAATFKGDENTILSSGGAATAVGALPYVAAGTTTDDDFLLLLAGPVTDRYPKGARLLSGKTKQYVIMPVGHVVDEHYTAYFNFEEGRAPDAAVEVKGGGREAEGMVADS